MLETNQLLHNRYRIIRQIGHGGMGAVYEAQDIKRFGKSVALKEILVDLNKIPNVKQREQIRRAFEREAEILTRIDDEAFPEVIEYFSEKDCQFLVMKLIGGKNLEKLLSEQETFFPVENVLDWMRQLLEAIDYLHTLRPQPIYHRDIKPQNLKLTERGKIKLLDFGIAKTSDLSKASTNSTFIGITYSFSPLEQCLRIPNEAYFEAINQGHLEKIRSIQEMPIDARCDIYSLGATAYNLLTKVLPPNAFERAMEVWAGRSDPLIPPNQINPQITPQVSEVILKAISVEPEERFKSAKEMEAALDIAAPTSGRKTVLQFVDKSEVAIKSKSVTTQLLPATDTDNEPTEQSDPKIRLTQPKDAPTELLRTPARSILFFENPGLMSKIAVFSPLVLILIGFVSIASYFSLRSGPVPERRLSNVTAMPIAEPPISTTNVQMPTLAEDTSRTDTPITQSSNSVVTRKTNPSVKRVTLDKLNETTAKRPIPAKSVAKPPIKKPIPDDRVSPP